MNRANTPYDSEHTPKADCDCCGKYAELSFSLSYGIDTWACDECRNPPRNSQGKRVIGLSDLESWPAAHYDENFKPRPELSDIWINRGAPTKKDESK
jgi:hypothetical protein